MLSNKLVRCLHNWVFCPSTRQILNFLSLYVILVCALVLLRTIETFCNSWTLVLLSNTNWVVTLIVYELCLLHLAHSRLRGCNVASRLRFTWNIASWSHDIIIWHLTCASWQLLAIRLLTQTRLVEQNRIVIHITNLLIIILRWTN